ncbi:hypothetical protein RRG08_028988 [Elysia crispata]|uniref:Uncharacterized protein n=1 Tax=Elysia crispata TaxID=231223 RepID=A0AAE1BDT9_9GAST|nr:hypothetical protein RRG08_028988 [Elysia crispata]
MVGTEGLEFGYILRNCCVVKVGSYERIKLWTTGFVYSTLSPGFLCVSNCSVVKVGRRKTSRGGLCGGEKRWEGGEGTAFLSNRGLWWEGGGYEVPAKHEYRRYPVLNITRSQYLAGLIRISGVSILSRVYPNFYGPVLNSLSESLLSQCLAGSIEMSAVSVLNRIIEILYSILIYRRISFGLVRSNGFDILIKSVAGQKELPAVAKQG